MEKIKTSPNACFRASNVIAQLVTTIESYGVVRELLLLQTELDGVVDAFKKTIQTKHKDLIARSQKEIPEDTEAETKASLLMDREEAKTAMDAIYAQAGNEEDMLKFPLVSAEKLWPHIRPEQRPLLRHLLPFLSNAEEGQ